MPTKIRISKEKGENKQWKRDYIRLNKEKN